MIKKVLVGLGVVAVAAMLMAARPTQSAKAEACAPKATVAGAKAEGCCGNKAAKAVVASTKPEGKSCADKAGCGDKMVASTVATKESCCKSTAAKPIAKGDKGCCNAKDALAKFKVFVDGEWKFYGCQGSATKGRAEWVTKAFNVGKVQPVTSRVTISGRRLA